MKRTPKTPAVCLNPAQGTIEIAGNSIPENSYELYHPIEQWVNEYIRLAMADTRIDISLEYFNTTSSKYIYEILKKFETYPKKVNIRWFYKPDDEEIFMAGEEYQALLNLDFQLIEIE